MSDMKCPFCQQELRPVSSFDNQDKRCVWYCPNCATNEQLWVMANERVWQELIRTHKALEITVDVLKEIDELLSSNRFDVREVPLLNITQTKISMLLKYINIEQITALEQKDK